MPRIAFVLASVSLLFSYQAPADFSGTWEMDASRSDSAHQAEPIGPVTLIVKQTPTEVSVETRRREKRNSPVTSETLTFRLDSTELPNVGVAGAQVKTKAHWDGARLVTETVRNIQDSTITTMHTYQLGPGGKELTIDKVLTVQHGYQSPGAQNTGKGTDVFKRKP